MKKRIPALLLSLAMLLSLCACGDKNQPEDKSTESDENHPDFVYAADFYPLETAAKYGLTPLAFYNGGVYCSGQEKVGEREHEGLSESYEGEFDIEQNFLYFAGLDGSFKKLESYECEKNTLFEDKPYYSASYGISKLFPDENGNLRFIESIYHSWYGGEGEINPHTEADKYYSNLKYFSDFYYRICDKDGKIISSTKIEVPENMYIDTHGVYIDSDGSCYCCCDNSVIKLEEDGSMSECFGTEAYPAKVYKLKDGRLAVLYYGEGRYLLPFEAEDLPENRLMLPDAGGEPVAGGGEFDVYYTNGINFCGYSFETGEESKLFSWLDVDINADCAYEFGVDDKENVALILRSYDRASGTSSCELALVSRKPWEEVPRKTEITMKGYAVDYEMMEIVTAYNRQSDSYRVKFTDYIEYNPDGFYCGSPIDTAMDAEGRMKLMTEIMAGDMPDILVLNYMPFEQLSAKGLLEDLYPYLDSDGQYSRKSIVPAALEAMASGDKLYRISKSFDIQTMCAPRALVGDREKLSYREAAEILSAMPEGSRIFDFFTSREDILDMSMSLDIDSYVNWETGQCSFDRPEFEDFLTYLSLIPTRAEIDSMPMDGMTAQDMEDPLSTGRQLLLRRYISSPSDYMHMIMMGGENEVPVGFPGIKGGGIMKLSCSCAMSAGSKNKEGAWDFMRSLLSEKIQKNFWGAPTNAELLNSNLEKAMQPVYKLDENGNILLDENGEKIKEPMGGYRDKDGNTRLFYEMSEGEARDYLELISGGNSGYDDHSAIEKIIWDEAQAFFAGQKSAAETAKLIQSKANIYVNEQR